MNKRSRIALTALACATAVTAAPLVGTAEAKKRHKSYAGTYEGPTEYYGHVSFQLTRGGKILNFKMTGAPLSCSVNGSSTETEETTTFTHGTVSMQKVSKKNPQGKKFELDEPFREDVADSAVYSYGGVLELTSEPFGGRVLNARGFNGESSFIVTDGPYSAPGTKVCGTKLIDWEAKRAKDKGYVAVGASGHLRPPLSEF